MRETDNFTNSTQSPFPCPILNLPDELQYQMQKITMHVARPFAIFLSVMSFVLNTFVLFTVKRFPHLRHPSVIILCSLSVTDLVFALRTLAIDGYRLLHPNICTLPFRENIVYIGILCYLTTLSNLALISRDRYLAISKPCWYQNHMTRLRAFKLIMFCWLGSAMVTLLVFTLKKKGLGDAPFFIVILLFYVGCILGIFFNYIRFFIANRRHARILGRNMGFVVQRERKMTRVVSVILLCFIFTFLPALVSPVIVIAMGLRLEHFRTMNNVLMMMNGFLNPVINYGRNKSMRRALFYMIKCN